MLTTRTAADRKTIILRWIQLLVGLFSMGVAVPLMIRSGLGLGPWDAFHVGLHNLTGITVGTASILVGIVIVCGSLKLGIRPGSGTIANMFLIGIFIDLVLPRVPPAPGFAWGIAYYLIGIGVVGIGTGMYISARLGNGPRDGLMMGISATRRWPVRRVRTFIELSALLGGWAMGSTIGLGTLLYALTIGPSVQVGLRLFGALPIDPADSEGLGAPEATPADATQPISRPNG